METVKNRRTTALGFVRSYGLLLGMALLSLVVAVIQPRFLHSDNLMNIMRQISVLGVVSLGMTIVILGGYIDLSISGTVSLVGVVVIGMQAQLGTWPPVFIGLAIGALAGLINAGIILFVRAGNGESLIITFGTQLLLTAAALIYSDGFSIKAPESSGFRVLGQGRLGFLSVSIVVFLAIALLLQFVMGKTRAGRSIYLLGGNREAAALTGIPARGYTVLMYVLCGLLAAAGAVILSSRTMSATPSMGNGYEMNAIMAVVIGGTSLRGGEGSVLKTIIGVVLVGIMNNALNIIGVSGYAQGIVQGAIIIAAVWLDGLKNSRGE